jgi:prepilin-type N-terminal cleavage/methylation domain-containing protein
MIRIIRKLLKRQNGFTVIESILAVAIAGIIGAAAVASTANVMQGTGLSNNFNTAINNLRTAADWMSRDIQMAQPISNLEAHTTASNLPLSLIWYDANQARDKYEIIYCMSGTDLERTVKKNDDGIALYRPGQTCHLPILYCEQYFKGNHIY